LRPAILLSLLAPAVAILVFTAACAPSRVRAKPDTDAPARLAAADAQVKAGCFECLLQAHKEYDALRTVAIVADAAAAGAVRTAVLLAIRERELGTDDSGYLQRARHLAASAAAPVQQALAPLTDIADTLPVRGAARQVSDDVALARMQAANRNRESWTELLRARADADPLTAYLWLAFNCAYVPAGQQAVDAWLGSLVDWRETPLIAFKAATCRSGQTTSLAQMLERDPRFVETNYFLAISAQFSGRIEQAIEKLERAYAWRPRWPAATHLLADDYLAMEEFDRAIDFFDRTLAVVPDFAEARLGKVRALTYAGRYEAALAEIEPLLAGRWLVGDARYWRAFNEAQLNRNDEAWADIELAARLLVNADVPKLAGMIAYRRQEIDVARAKFEESRERNPADCETGYYLGVGATRASTPRRSPPTNSSATARASCSLA
jgi:tetratricopeptide (TPR) repeat protein